MCPGAPPKDYKMNAKEQAAMDRAKWWMGEHLNEGHMGYAIEMRTRPQTIGVAFNDNPVGIMMFIGEKYDELADPTIGTATLEKEDYVKDVCTTLSLYFFTPPSIMTSMLCYTFNVRHEVYTEFNAKEENLIRVPLGVSTFPYDAFPVPKAGAETTTTNLKFFRGEYSGSRIQEPKLMVSKNVNTVGTSPVWRCTTRWLQTCATSLASFTRLSRLNRVPLRFLRVVECVVGRSVISNDAVPIHEMQRANAVNLVSGNVGDNQTDVGYCSQALDPDEDHFVAGLYDKLRNFLVILAHCSLSLSC